MSALGQGLERVGVVARQGLERVRVVRGCAVAYPAGLRAWPAQAWGVWRFLGLNGGGMRCGLAFHGAPVWLAGGWSPRAGTA